VLRHNQQEISYETFCPDTDDFAAAARLTRLNRLACFASTKRFAGRCRREKHPPRQHQGSSPLAAKMPKRTFSADDKQLIFQSTRDGRECDQIYYHERGWIEPEADLHWAGSHYLLLFLSERQAHSLFFERTWVPKNVPRSLIFPKAIVWAVYDSSSTIFNRRDLTVQTSSV